MAANNAFHAEIAVMGGNAVLAELADIVGRRVQWYYRMVAPARGHGSWAEHAEMIDVIEAGDPERAQALARKHTERTRQAYHQPRSARLGEPDHAHRVGAVLLRVDLQPERTQQVILGRSRLGWTPGFCPYVCVSLSVT